MTRELAQRVPPRCRIAEESMDWARGPPVRAGTPLPPPACFQRGLLSPAIGGHTPTSVGQSDNGRSFRVSPVRVAACSATRNRGLSPDALRRCAAGPGGAAGGGDRPSVSAQLHRPRFDRRCAPLRRCPRVKQCADLASSLIRASSVACPLNHFATSRRSRTARALSCRSHAAD